ncbi:MAG: hypothetical protein Q7U97_10625 [Rhodocyclaceae bacterium]|nr:hypothetical protein [Rhodocyclaceae bacterium]
MDKRETMPAAKGTGCGRKAGTVVKTQMLDSGNVAMAPTLRYAFYI